MFLEIIATTGPSVGIRPVTLQGNLLQWQHAVIWTLSCFHSHVPATKCLRLYPVGWISSKNQSSPKSELGGTSSTFLLLCIVCSSAVSFLHWNSFWSIDCRLVPVGAHSWAFCIALVLQTTRNNTSEEPVVLQLCTDCQRHGEWWRVRPFHAWIMTTVILL